MAAPKLRFKADDGSEFPEWEEKRLGEVARVKVGERPSVIFDTVTDYEYINAGVGNSGYIDSYNCVGDTVTTPSRGQGGIGFVGYQQYKFWLGPLCYSIKSDKADILTKYLYYFLVCHSKSIVDLKQVGTIPAINRDDLLKIRLSVPSFPEQKKIASFLSMIDEIIQSTESELNAWQERKKGVMQKIFSREVRFKADDGSEFPEWEEKRLGDVFVERSERSADNLDLLSVTIANGVIRQNESDKRNVSSVDKSNYKRVYIGDLAYNSMRMWQGAEGVSAYDGIVSPAYTVLVPKKQEYVYFYEYMFKRTEMLHIFQRYSQGLTSDTWNLKYPALSHISVVVPSLLEQKKIAECLSSVDGVIRNIQAELSAWKEFKKGLLQQMFV